MGVQRSGVAGWDRAEVLERLGGDEELLREVTAIFLQETPKLVERLRGAVASGDFREVEWAAHSVKGEVGYLGAGVAFEGAGRLEEMGREKNLVGAAEVLASLEGELDGLYFAMKDAAGGVQ